MAWLELTAPGSTVGVTLRVTSTTTLERPVSEFPDLQVRYLVHGVPVSPWLSAPFNFTLAIGNPALEELPDGVHDLSLDVQHPDRANFKPRPVYLHLARRPDGQSARADPQPRRPVWRLWRRLGGRASSTSSTADAKRVGYPVDPAVTPFKTPPHEANTWQEEMSPHTDLFRGVQMWWEHAAARRRNSPARSCRSGTRTTAGCACSGSRIGFRSSTVRAASAGRARIPAARWTAAATFVFVEAGGPLRCDEAGRRVGHDRWVARQAGQGSDLRSAIRWSVVRRNMELRGTWGERPVSPTVAASAPRSTSPSTRRTTGPMYVAGYEDQCIWKVATSADWSPADGQRVRGRPGTQQGLRGRHGPGRAVQRSGVARVRPGVRLPLRRGPGQRRHPAHQPGRRRHDAGGPARAARTCRRGWRAVSRSVHLSEGESRRRALRRDGRRGEGGHSPGHLSCRRPCASIRAVNSWSSNSGSGVSAESIR